jgi:hypothetical protein
MAELRVERADATEQLVREAWAEVLADIGREGSDARAFVSAAKVDADRLSAAELTVQEESGDFGATILVTIVAPVAVHILTSLWDDHVRPRLRDKDVDGGQAIE